MVYNIIIGIFATLRVYKNIILSVIKLIEKARWKTVISNWNHFFYTPTVPKVLSLSLSMFCFLYDDHWVLFLFKDVFLKCKQLGFMFI